MKGTNMSKKDKPEDKEVVEKKMCMDCKHRQKPNSEFITRGWCDNPKSPNSQKYVYKGDTCPAFKALKKEREKEDAKVEK